MYIKFRSFTLVDKECFFIGIMQINCESLFCRFGYSHINKQMGFQKTQQKRVTVFTATLWRFIARGNYFLTIRFVTIPSAVRILVK